MKRIVSLVLALMMALSMAVVASAEEAPASLPGPPLRSA